MAVSGGLIASGKAREVRVEAVVTRADGRIERLGAISYWHANPLRRALMTCLIKLKEAFR